MYLGVPLLHKRIPSTTEQFIGDLVRKKLNGWDAKKLSMTGRVTLAKVVLVAILNYFMNTAIGVCNEIDKLARCFIWGSSKDNRKLALVKWENCWMPLENGGLWEIKGTK